MKDLMQPCTSNLVFKRKIQVCLEKSSTTVKKYLCLVEDPTSTRDEVFQ